MSRQMSGTKKFGGEKMYRTKDEGKEECIERNFQRDNSSSRKKAEHAFKTAARGIWNILKSSMQIFHIAIALLITIILASIAASTALAATNLIALQGTADNGGSPVNGNLVVIIWDQPTGGSMLYNSSSDFNNAISNGRFDVMLGSGTQILTLDYGVMYYMDISVNGIDLDFNGSERKMFESSVGNISGQYIKTNAISGSNIALDTITDANINSVAAISKSKISTSSTWAESDIPALSNSWAGTLNATRIVSASLLNVNSSQYCNINNLQSLNDTGLITSLNSSKAAVAACPSGQVVQNTTSSGVQCIPTGGVGTVISVTRGLGFNNTGTSITSTGTLDINASIVMMVSDQRYNNTALIGAVNTSTNLQSLGFNTTTQLNNIYLGINDQRYNDTSLINSLNTSKAAVATCPSGQVVQNTTSGGVQCVSTGGVGTVTSVTRGLGFNNTGTSITSSGTLDINASIVMMVSDQRYNDTSLINGVNTSANLQSLGFNTTVQLNNIYLGISDQRYNNTALIGAVNTSTNLQSLGFNTTTQLNNLYLGINDQRYNNTALIGAVNTSTNLQSLGFNTTTQLNNLYLGVSDQRYNDTSLINAVNTSTNLQSLGFNTTAQLNNIYLGISDQRYNNTLLINAVNTSANLQSIGFNTTAQLNNLYLGINDQRYNSTSLIGGVNTTTNIQSLGFNTTTQLNNIYLGINDQRYNDTSLINSLNSSKAATGACPNGQVINATTSNSIVCVPVLGFGATSLSASSIDSGVFGSDSGLDSYYTFNHNVSIGNNLTVGDSLNVANNANIGDNLTVGDNLNVVDNAVISDNLSVGANLYVGNYTYYNMSSDPSTPPPGQGIVYVKKISGRGLTKFKAPSGVDYALQPSLFQNSISVISAGGGATVNVFGTLLGGGAGTITHPATTERYGYMANIVTATAINAAAGTGETNTRWFRGSAVGANGFFFNARVAFPDATYVTCRTFTGLTSGTMLASVNSDNPAGDNVGFQYSTLRGDTNWKFMTKDNVNQNVTDTGLVFNATGVYDMFIYCTPQCQNISWRIDDVINGVTAEGTAVNNLPRNNTALRAGLFINTTSATARSIRFQRIYVESDR